MLRDHVGAPPSGAGQILTSRLHPSFSVTNVEQQPLFHAPIDTRGRVNGSLGGIGGHCKGDWYVS